MRVKKIIWQFLTHSECLSINQIMEYLNVSKNTVLADFRFIKKEEPDLDLISTSNGHTLNGSEEEKSRYIFNELQKDSSGLIAQLIDELPFPVISVMSAKNDVSELEKDISSRFTENAISKLIRVLKFRIFRISMGKIIDSMGITQEDITHSTNNIISSTTGFLQKNGINSKYEILFFSELILCLSLIHI